MKILINTRVSVFPTPEKFALYDWLDCQGWQSESDYWMRIHNRLIENHTRATFISVIFDDTSKAALFKLAWGAP